MYRLLVRMTVNNFDLLAEYERIAATVMADYQGAIACAYEMERVGTIGEEIHIVEFASEALFNDYRQDPRLSAAAALREQAIYSMAINVLGTKKHYES